MEYGNMSKKQFSGVSENPFSKELLIADELERVISQFNRDNVALRDGANTIRDLTSLLIESHEVLRSANSVSQRRGAHTNWDSFNKELGDILEKQHSTMYPKC